MPAESRSSQILKRAAMRFVREAMELPGIALISRPMYRRYFSKPY